MSGLMAAPSHGAEYYRRRAAEAEWEEYVAFEEKKAADLRAGKRGVKTWEQATGKPVPLNPSVEEVRAAGGKGTALVGLRHNQLGSCGAPRPPDSPNRSPVLVEAQTSAGGRRWATATTRSLQRVASAGVADPSLVRTTISKPSRTFWRRLRPTRCVPVHWRLSRSAETAHRCGSPLW